MAMLTRDQIYTTQNRAKTLCLIKELCKVDDDPIFTVRDEKEGYISLQKLYIDLTVEDPSETTFAEAVFGDFLYWTMLRDTPKFTPFVEEWRLIADAKRKSIAFQSIIDEVKHQGKSAFSAAKFLIDEPWKDKRNPKVKASNKKSTEMAATDLYKEDAQRLAKEFLQ